MAGYPAFWSSLVAVPNQDEPHFRNCETDTKRSSQGVDFWHELVIAEFSPNREIGSLQRVRASRSLSA